ncbi:MAG TPA: hypothetical protein PLF81_21575 [Candidatus Anammoximicrobium sp.]|nr:hypothetical protein [Candidatus Anammoximicrobium sp.]
MWKPVLCLMAIAGTLCPADTSWAAASKTQKAQLKAVFVGVPAKTAAQIVRDLERQCPAIEFVQTETVAALANPPASAASEREGTGKLDGVLLFCGDLPHRQHLSTGLPTLLVDCTASAGPTAEFDKAVALAEQCGTRFITAAYRTGPGAAAASLESLVEKTNLFGVLKRLRGSKLITVQDHDGLNRIDQGTYYDAPIQDYDRKYPGILREHLGVEIIVVRSTELNEFVAAVPEAEAEKLAKMWEQEATEVKNVKHHDILRAARSYLAQRELLRKYDADAITLDTATLTFKAYGSAKRKEFGTVAEAQPLVIMELSKEHIQACCQSHIDCLVTQMIGTYLTGGSGFTGDFLNDWAFEPAGERPENVMIVAHCGAPITPWGHDRLPYLIRDHIHNKAFGGDNTPTGTTVQWPANEAATIVKFDVFTRQVSVFTGEVLDGNALYKDFANCICRNKLVTQIDDPENCYMLPSDPKAGAFRQCNQWDPKHRHWGGHQVAFYGNLQPAIQDLAALIGFEVVASR